MRVLVFICVCVCVLIEEGFYVGLRIKERKGRLLNFELPPLMAGLLDKGLR